MIDNKNILLYNKYIDCCYIILCLTLKKGCLLCQKQFQLNLKVILSMLLKVLQRKSVEVQRNKLEKLSKTMLLTTDPVLNIAKGMKKKVQERKTRSNSIFPIYCFKGGPA
jgi:hypothetical protein